MNSALKHAAGATVTYLKSRVEDEEAVLRAHLYDILARRQLSALFQPIVHMQSGDIIAYEGLIRGPSDSPLHSPMNLFKAARANGLTPTQLALGWCYSRWFVASTIIGATNLDQLKQNIDAFEVQLPKEVIQACDAIHARITNPGQ